jgi:hypothetical protein
MLDKRATLTKYLLKERELRETLQKGDGDVSEDDDE